jgi:hypothetical protein
MLCVSHNIVCVEMVIDVTMCLNGKSGLLQSEILMIVFDYTLCMFDEYHES